MRALLYLGLTAILIAIVGPPGCRRLQERMLLSLVRESARPVQVIGGDPLRFQFPVTSARVVAVIDYDEARRSGGHLSFVPPDGSDRWLWAASVCASWDPRCMESAAPASLDGVTYGSLPDGLRQLEPPTGAPRALALNHLYGLALLGDRLFALTPFYRDDAGAMHLMDGTRFAEAVVRGRREEIAAFVAGASRPATP